jgi:hypothetical protein
MTLTQEDIDFIKANMADWLIEQSLGKPTAVYEIELRERMVRVEEELKHQRELMQQGFAQTERRFEQADQRNQELRQDMLGRFEQVDKRFEQADQRDRELRQDMLERFEQVDKRFEQVDRRFQQVDQHLEQMGQRFSAIDSRFDEMIRRHDRHFLWLIGFISTVGALIVAAVKLW